MPSEGFDVSWKLRAKKQGELAVGYENGSDALRNALRDLGDHGFMYSIPIVSGCSARLPFRKETGAINMTSSRAVTDIKNAAMEQGILHSVKSVALE